MEPVVSAVLSTQNIALILAVAACIVCGLFHWNTRKEDRAERAKRDEADRVERAKRDEQAAAERAALYELVRQNTNAMHELRNTLSALNGRVL